MKGLDNSTTLGILGGSFRCFGHRQPLQVLTASQDAKNCTTDVGPWVAKHTWGSDRIASSVLLVNKARRVVAVRMTSLNMQQFGICGHLREVPKATALIPVSV